MRKRLFTISILSACVFAGTVLAATDMTSTLEDPLNPIWQQTAGSGTITIFNPDIPLTFRQVAWMFARYDHFVIQPLRDKVDHVESTSGSGTATMLSCEEHQVGDTYASMDRCNICTCTHTGAMCTTNPCPGNKSSASYSSASSLSAATSAETKTSDSSVSIAPHSSEGSMARCGNGICDGAEKVFCKKDCPYQSSTSQSSASSLPTVLGPEGSPLGQNGAEAGASSVSPPSASSSSLSKGTCTTFMQNGQSQTECSI